MKQLRILTFTMAVLMLLASLAGAACAQSKDADETAPNASPQAASDTAMPDADAEAGGGASDGTAAESAGAAVTAEAARPVLYIVLADCGTTLYGSKAFGNSIVTEGGDPNGELLRLIAQAPSRFSPQSLISIFGYNDKLLSQGAKISLLSDSAAVDAQVQALLNIPEGQRWSSDLASALNSLGRDVIAAQGLAERYDCRLVLITGGAININNRNNSANVADVASAISQLEGLGVAVQGFGFNLTQSPTLNTRLNASALLLTEAQFPGGSYAAIPVYAQGGASAARLRYAAAIIDYFAAQGGYAPSVNLQPGVQVPADAVCVVNSGGSYQACYGSELNQLLAALDSPSVRYCVKGGAQAGLSDAQAVSAPTAANVRAVLDADGDSALDGAALLAGQAAQVPCPLLTAAGFTAVSDHPEIVAAQVADGALALNPLAGGSATITIAAVANPADAVNLRVAVKDYRLTWRIEDGDAIEIGDGGETVVTSASTTLNAVLERRTGSGEWTELAQDGNDYIAARNDGTSLSLAVRQPGEYRVTAWIEDGTLKTPAESRDFKADISFDALDAIALVAPYFKEQPGQRAAITAGGGAPDLTGYSAAAEPAGIADVYLDSGAACLYIVPKAAGECSVILRDAGGAERLSAGVTVSSLTKQPLFWILAVAAPVCLIGLTAMLVILVSKLKRR